MQTEVISARRPGNVLDQRLRVIEQVVAGGRRLRHNQKLLGEYEQLIRDYRNDVIEVLFSILDSDRSVLVPRNTLSRQDYATARRCNWPSHDQHLLAAALGGIDPSIHVTEPRLAQCGRRILASFGVRIDQL
jgi:hypothetical protein